VLDLPDGPGAQVGERTELAVERVALGDGDQPVIAHGCPVALGLLRLDHAEQAGGQQTAGEGGLVHEHEHVDRVAVRRQRAGQEAEVEREDGARRQHTAEPEESERVVVVVLVATPSRRLDHDVERARLGVNGAERLRSAPR
jgi:hypothetical protein